VGFWGFGEQYVTVFATVFVQLRIAQAEERSEKNYQKASFKFGRQIFY